MPHSKTTCRIFWPTDILKSSNPSFLVGWENSKNDYLVAFNISCSNSNNILDLQTILKNLLYTQNNHHDIYKICGSKNLCIIGLLNYSDKIQYDNSNNNNINIKTKIDNNYPLHVFYSKNHHLPKFNISTRNASSIQIILYDKPRSHKMEFYSLKKINLELADRTKLTVLDEEFEKEFAQIESHNRILSLKMKQHCTTSLNLTNQEKNLNNCIISQINCAYELGYLIQIQINNLYSSKKNFSSSSSSYNLLKINLISLSSFFINLFSKIFFLLWLFLKPIFVIFIMSIRIIIEGILLLLEFKPAALWISLKDISSTALQLDLRLQQMCYWPIQYMRIKTPNKKLYSTFIFQPEYIRFYNSLWLVANDIIIGIALYTIIIDNQYEIVKFIDNFVNSYLTLGLSERIKWLMDYPGGLKLNNGLANFFGELLLWSIEFWDNFLNSCRPFIHSFVLLIGYSGYLGATFSISLASDLISFMTFHIYAFYITAARIYGTQITIIYSLFQLFQGKRRNILRHRIDSCEYSPDELLIGTLFFTVLIFLLPTVLVFYLAFAMARAGIILLNVLLESSLSFLNHFPLFAIMLRFKDSKRIPGGIYFEIITNTKKDYNSVNIIKKANHPGLTNNPLPTAYIYLKSKPLPFKSIFHHYYVLSARIQVYYLSGKVFYSFLTGGFVAIKRNRLYSILYSMLPERRVGIFRLWHLLRNKRDRFNSEPEPNSKFESELFNVNYLFYYILFVIYYLTLVLVVFFLLWYGIK